MPIEGHDPWTEPGRHVNEDGQIVVEWPPKGRFAQLWAEFKAWRPDESDWDDLRALLTLYDDENSTLISYTDENGEWHDVEPDWTKPEGWLR